MINIMSLLLPLLLGQYLKMHMDHLNPLFGLHKQTYPLTGTAETHPLRTSETQCLVLMAFTLIALGVLFNLFLSTVIKAPPGTAGPSA